MKTEALKKRLGTLEAELNEIRETLEKGKLPWIHPGRLLSAINLVQYLHIRKKSIVSLQDKLHASGLSSLASSESHIHRQLQEVMLRLGHSFSRNNLNMCDADWAGSKLQQNAAMLFGEKSTGSKLPIMVTLDSSAHLNEKAICSLLKKGMRVARINCAHDHSDVWSKMVELVRKAEKETGIPCKIYMDLAGPKFRMNLIKDGVSVEKFKIEHEERILLTETKSDAGKIAGKSIYCQIPGITTFLKKGTTMMMDDGKTEAIVTGETLSGREITISRISGKPKLQSGKGINFLNTIIPIASLTHEDIKALDFVKKHADLVGYSFVRTADDLKQLHQHLYKQKTAKAPLLIIKIETPESVINLPELLLYAMQYPHFGVMIARGDLAVEIGFERMSEIQEEILWICEAAHTPVIWATQVLEQLNKTGIASRSEITDAYKAAQAECIMINKGEYTPLVLDTLRDLVQRSHRHHFKKRYEMQALGIAINFKFPAITK
jgi:pyruvate kinase